MTPEFALAPGLLLLAGAAAPIPGWLVPAIGVGGTVLAGIVSGVTALLVKRMSKPTEEASAGKTRTETVAAEVAVIREVLGEVRTQQAKDAERAEREIRAMQTRLDAVIAGMERHQAWDKRATRALRKLDADFPGPPPLGVD